MYPEKQKISLTVDAVVFTVMNDDLKILLVKRKYDPYKQMYALPGGFVHNDEELDAAVCRELYEETNVKDIFLKKLTAYGDVKRDPRGRIVSVVYLALIDSETVKLEAKTDAEVASWFSVYSLPKLAFDHDVIIKDALHDLRYEIQISNIAYQLLPKKFTLTELQRAYEVILDKTLDKRNFRKRLFAQNIVDASDEYRNDGAHRPAQLFTFKEKKYSFIKDKINVFM